MNIFYDQQTKQWHCEQGTYQFGKNKIHAGTKSTCSFVMHQEKNRIGPLVGIITSGRGRTLTGNWEQFIAIQQTLRQYGGLSFVFAPDGIQDTYIDGFVYTGETFVSCRFPLPDVIYNRIPYRKQEHAILPQLHRIQIPFFNPGFFSKWDVYQTLRKDTFLRQHLLPTTLLTQPYAITKLLAKYPALYIKDNHAAKGNQLFYLFTDGAHMYLRNNDGDITATHEAALWDTLRSRTYIAQPALVSDTHEGRKYDLRVVAHHIGGTFSVSGVGVRVAKKDGIVTHVPNGGEIVPTTALTRPPNIPLLQQIVAACGTSLCTAFGRVREFSLDIGVDQTGAYYIFEANAKPMRFDEEEIQHNILKNLITIFIQEAEFSRIFV